MHVHRPTPLIALPLAVLTQVLAGCSLSPRQDPSQFYVLSAASDTAGAVAGPAGASGLELGIGPVSFPEYLDRPQMVTRVGANQLQFSETERWAEPLKGSFTSVLAENLQQLLGARTAYMYPWYASLTPDYTVEVDVIRFERDGSGAVELRCQWAIFDADRIRLLTRAGDYQRSAADASTAAAVEAMSRTVEDLSRDIAAAIRRPQG